MKFSADPAFFNQTGHYKSGPYSIRNTGPKSWDVFVYDKPLVKAGSFRAAKAACEKHYNDGGLKK